MADPIKAIVGHIRRRCDGLALLSIERGDSHPWQSLLFDGGRHHIALRLQGNRVEEAIAELRDEIGAAEFIIPGHLIAEISLAGIDQDMNTALVRLDAMTIAQ